MTTLSKLFSKAKSMRKQAKTLEQDSQDKNDTLESKTIGHRKYGAQTTQYKLNLSPVACESLCELADLYGLPPHVFVEMITLKFLDEHGYRVDYHTPYSSPFILYLEGRRGRLTSSLRRS